MADQKPLTPSGLIWKRLKRSIPAMTGLFIICVAAFISVFCYVIMPDQSPDANEMNLSLSTLPPGTTVNVIKVPVMVELSEPGFLQGIFSGRPSGYREIPYNSLKILNDSVEYTEFSNDTEAEANSIKIPIWELFTGTPNYTLENDKLTFSDLHNSKVSIIKRDAREQFLFERIQSRTFVLGTDRFGRDLLSRIFAGTRISMSVGFIAVLISLVIGIVMGSLAGFFRGKTDDIVMWLTNVIWSIPTLLLVIAITMALGKGFAQVFIAVGLTMWVEVARVVRGQIFSLREMEFVEAGRALGFTNFRIVLRHVLPNILSPVIVIAASNFASAILLEAGLSFLGMGAQPPTPSWGMMIKENYGYIIVDAAYLAIYPGLAIMFMVLAFTWLGNGLRDALDQKF